MASLIYLIHTTSFKMLFQVILHKVKLDYYLFSVAFLAVIEHFMSDK